MKTLYMSGYSKQMAVQNGMLEAGAPFIQKPFSSSELSSAVRSILELH